MGVYGVHLYGPVDPLDVLLDILNTRVCNYNLMEGDKI